MKPRTVGMLGTEKPHQNFEKTEKPHKKTTRTAKLQTSDTHPLKGIAKLIKYAILFNDDFYNL